MKTATHRWTRHAGRDSGMVTAEMAAALPVLMLLVVTAVYAVQVAGMRVRCLDAAREVARAAARGDPRAAALGRDVLPGASVVVLRSSSTVSAEVTVRLRPLGSGLPAVTISEQVTAATEPVAAAHDPGARRSATRLPVGPDALTNDHEAPAGPAP